MSSEDQKRYRAAIHAMQSGVMMMMNYESKEVESKHLRVGVNSAHISDAAIIKLLIEKGVFGLDEFEKALADCAENEVRLYEKSIAELMGVDAGKITLK